MWGHLLASALYNVDRLVVNKFSECGNGTAVILYPTVPIPLPSEFQEALPELLYFHCHRILAYRLRIFENIDRWFWNSPLGQCLVKQSLMNCVRLFQIYCEKLWFLNSELLLYRVTMSFLFMFIVLNINC